MVHRVHLVVAALWISGLAVTPAAAQTGRVGGTVRDEGGQPIRGAMVTAENPQASPGTWTATTDERGRFSIIGLRSGIWTFTAQAPGFAPSQGLARIQTLGNNPPVEFRLAKGAAGPGGGALAGVNTKELQADLQNAEVLFNAGQYDQAIAAYQAILQKTAALGLIHLQIGHAYRLKKDYDSAIAEYQAVLKDDPDNERAKIAIGMTYLEKPDLDAADRTLAEVATLASASREVFYALGEVKFAKNQTEEAAAWYEKAAAADPSWAKPIFKLALVGLNKGDKDRAVRLLEKVVAVEPASTEAAQAKAVLEQLRK